MHTLLPCSVFSPNHDKGFSTLSRIKSHMRRHGRQKILRRCAADDIRYSDIQIIELGDFAIKFNPINSNASWHDLRLVCLTEIIAEYFPNSL